MTTLTFDTLKFIETLEEAGFQRAHASAVSVAVRDAQNAAGFVTKADLHSEIALVRKDIDLVRKDVDLVRKDVDVLESRLTLKLGSIMVTGFGVVIAVLFKLLH